MTEPTTLAARARRATTVATLAGIAMVTGLLDRAGGRRSDRGDVVQTVILIAGFAALAIAIVAWVGPVVMRYLGQIV